YSMFQHRFSVVGAYVYQNKFRDDYRGESSVIDYSAISQDTDSTSHAGELYLIYSTVADYYRKEKAIPWEAIVAYHHTFQGTNTPDFNYTFLRLRFFFN